MGASSAANDAAETAQVDGSMKALVTIRQYLAYIGILVPITITRCLPHCVIRLMARIGGIAMYATPSLRRLVLANIATALPEIPEPERRRIARESFRHLALNMLEFLWVEGIPARVRRCYPPIPPEILDPVIEHRKRGERIIFVTPHLGSWECSGLVVPYYAGFRLAAVAKPIRNPFLNRRFTRWREASTGLHVIFSRGAIRAAIAALRAGESVGLLTDQNTKGREGGVFLDFFGLPVACTTSPALLKRYCDAHDIPATIIFGCSVREGAEEKLVAYKRILRKPFSEYADDREVIRELLGYSEELIRAYPEQYLWLYRRFQYIPEGTPEELRRRYPYYATTPRPSFYRRRRKAEKPDAGDAAIPAETTTSSPTEGDPIS